MFHLDEVVKLVHKQDWTKIANFNVNINPVNQDFGNIIKWGSSIETQKMIDLSVKSVNIPQYSNAVIEEYIANRWFQANSRDELFVMNITFRDMNGAELYRKFLNAHFQSKGNYFDKSVFEIQVSLDSENGPVNILNTNMALVTSISQLQLYHENANEILEFDVEFKVNTPLHSNQVINNIKQSGEQSNITQSLNKVEKIFSNALSKGLDNLTKKVDSLLKSW